ncbi:hypothetical protein QE385_003839 [Sphingomonas sp. SORGH_AS 950]|nr:hypothetical protein [Sphingomonas sp. SORGH_AS_0950]
MSDLSRRGILAGTTMAGLGSIKAGFSQGDAGSGARHTPSDFGGDPSGQRDSTAALKRWAAQGGALFLPAGHRYLVSDTLIVTVDGTHIDGHGTLVAGSSLLGRTLLRIDASDCIVENIQAVNPGRVQAKTGPRTGAVLLRGHRNQVRGCTIVDFQMCLTTDSTGEFFDNLFAFNRCVVIGTGGEDRGDGITDWGGRSRIIGNVVEAAPGIGGKVNDCRIGIHVEAIGADAREPGNPDHDAASEITGNIVIPSPDGSGRFRRCYSAEGIRGVRIVGNYGRGWTWDGIWLVGASSRAVAIGNVLRHDSPAPAPTDGAEWSPDRAGILVYASLGVAQRDVRISDNIVELGRANNYGIAVRAAQSDITGIVISNNSCIADQPGNRGSVGIFSTDVSDVQIKNNRVKGPWHYGIAVIATDRADVADCTVSGTADFGISCQNNPGLMRVARNVVEQCAHGIESAGNKTAILSDNVLDRVAGMNLSFAGRDNAIVQNNISTEAGARVVQFGEGLRVALKNNIGFDQ